MLKVEVQHGASANSKVLDSHLQKFLYSALSNFVVNSVGYRRVFNSILSVGRRDVWRPPVHGSLFSIPVAFGGPRPS